MGDKARARRVMKKAGVPILPGSDGPIDSEEKALKIAKEIGYPVIVKATAGGGGRGMRVVRAAGELSHAFKTAQREAEAAFGVGDVYLEKYVESPRHIEFQILGDQHGSVVHLGERECSIQRRHQKLLEESPSPALSEKMRRKMGDVVIDAAKAVQYTNAGTFEFLMDPDGHFYFMEANTRLQVEHPVTEMVTGIDIVKEQIRIAAGERLSFKQSEVTFTGHSIECRINAEDPETFVPSPGLIHVFSVPGGPGVRVETARAFGLHDLAVLRLDDREDHRARPRPPGSDRAHAPHARDDRHRGDQDHHPAAPADPGRPRFRRREAEHVVHGAAARASAPRRPPRRSRVTDSPRIHNPIPNPESRIPSTFPALNAILDADAAARAGWSLVDLARAFLTAARGSSRFGPRRARRAPTCSTIASAIVERARAARRDRHRQRPRGHRAALGRRRRARRAGRPAARGGATRFSAAARSSASRPTRRSRSPRALHEPITYLAIGPVFGTATKDTGYDAVGLEGVASRGACRGAHAAFRSSRSAASRSSARPTSIAAGAASVAVISDLLATGDPAARVRAYLERLADAGNV